MAVIRNVYDKTYSNYTIQGLTVTLPNSKTLSKVHTDVTIDFIRFLYTTLEESGFGVSLEKNENESYIKIGDCKIYIYIKQSNSNFRVYAYIFPCDNNGNIVQSANGSCFEHDCEIGYKNSSTNQLDFITSVSIRGYDDCFLISLGAYNNISTENIFVFVSKCKDLINNRNCYFISDFGSNSFFLDSSFKYAISGKTTSITTTSSSTTETVFDAVHTNKGLNSVSKYVVVPQTGYYNSFLFPSMIQGNTTIFSDGNYYKIGERIYYCIKTHLFRVG